MVKDRCESPKTSGIGSRAAEQVRIWACWTFRHDRFDMIYNVPAIVAVVIVVVVVVATVVRTAASVVVAAAAVAVAVAVVVV